MMRLSIVERNQCKLSRIGLIASHHTSCRILDKHQHLATRADKPRRFPRINESSAHLPRTLARRFKCPIIERGRSAQVHQVSLAAHAAQALFNRRAIGWKAGYHGISLFHF
jgi:hypothetical protein